MKTMSEQQRRNIKGLWKDCIKDAKEITKANGLKPYQSTIVSIAVTIFDKQFDKQQGGKENDNTQ